MKNPIYQVDAFASGVFSGNPAAVCPLEQWLPDEMLQNIAVENNLSETAYFVKNEDQYDLRWFTPKFEIDLCGHATLASSHVLYTELGYKGDKIEFNTLSGLLEVSKESNGYSMIFPGWIPEPTHEIEQLNEGLNARPAKVLRTRDLVAVFDSQEEIENIEPDFRRLNELDCVGIIVTAPGTDCDFVSRFFAPRAGVDEDPVTGSAHSTLIKYWSQVLQKKGLFARQLSERGGELWCEDLGEKVRITGKAVTYMKGEITI